MSNKFNQPTISNIPSLSDVFQKSSVAGSANQFLKTNGAGSYTFESISAVLPAIQLRKAAQQSINTNIITAITWPSEDYKQGSISHSTTTNTHRVVIGTSGFYSVSTDLWYETSSTSRRALFWCIHNTTELTDGSVQRYGNLRAIGPVGNTDMSLSTSTIVYIPSGSWIVLYAEAPVTFNIGCDNASNPYSHSNMTVVLLR